jgi:hypothetical protein
MNIDLSFFYWGEDDYLGPGPLPPCGIYERPNVGRRRRGSYFAERFLSAGVA